MNLQDLFIVCPHYRRSAHGVDDGSWCQGGRPVTLEDLDAIEVNPVAVRHRGLVEGKEFPEPWLVTVCAKAEPEKFRRYALIPFPQMVAGESL